MAENTKEFYQFTVKRNEAYENRINSRSEKYSFAEILGFLGNPTDSTEFKKALTREIRAIKAAMEEQSENRLTTYNSNRRDDSGHEIPNSNGNIPVVQDYFRAEDDYLKNHEDKYTEYQQKLAELGREPTTAERAAFLATYGSSITAHDTMVAAQEKMEKLLSFDGEDGDLALLEQFPDKIQENIFNTHGACRDPEQFDKVYNDILSDRNSVSDYVYEGKENDRNRKRVKDETGHDVVQNEHRMSIRSDGSLAHTIRNLDNTGLDVSWIGDQLGLAHCTSELTKAQIKALAKYCINAGVDIEDYNQLADLKVIDNEKDKKEIGTAGEVLKEEIENIENERHGGEHRFEPTIDPNANSTEPAPAFGQWLAPVTLKNDINVQKAMEKAALDRFALMPPGYRGPGQVRIRHFGGKCVISVYNNEDDMNADGKLDKNGKHTHTKQCAITFDYGKFPPSAELYIPTGGKITPDHIRTALGGFKALGCKYFKMPDGTIAGKDGRGAMIEASVKTGLVPVCKPSTGGTILKEADIKDIPEMLEKEPLDTKEKIEYQMRLHAELERQEDYLTRTKSGYKTNSSVSTTMAKLQYGARFAQFSASYLETLQGFISKQTLTEDENKAWDEADSIAATAAMNELIKGISEGKLNGKPFNPLSLSYEQVQETFVQHMADKKVEVVQKIKNAQKTERENKNKNGETGTPDERAVRSVSSIYQEALKNTCSGLQGYGVKLDPQVQRSPTKYKESRYENGNIPVPEMGNDRLNSIAQNSLQRAKFQPRPVQNTH